MKAQHYGATEPTAEQANLNGLGWPTMDAQAYALAQALGLEPDGLAGLLPAPHTLDHLAAWDLV
nr:hypothetical protein [uncultured Rhodoferax sp.]